MIKQFSLKNRKMIEAGAGLALVGVLIFCCLLVLKPFFTAMLWAAILVFASWPVFQFIKRRLTGGKALEAAGLMMTLIVLLLLIPLWLLARSSLDMAAWGMAQLQMLRETGIPRVMTALQDHPFFGQYADSIQSALKKIFSDTDQLSRWSSDTSKVAVGWLVQRGVSIGYGIFQIAVSLIFMFYFYLRGENVADSATALMERVAGPFMLRLRHRIALTLNTVVRGTVGTAFVQAIAAAVGFAIFNVPNVILFSALVFVLGLLPMGPPLLWIPLGLWLLAHEQMGNGIGLLVYGGIVISGIDNLVRPVLIAGSWDFTAFLRRRRMLVTGAITGLLIGFAFAFVGLPWVVGIAVFIAVGITPFASAGVVSLLGGAIWLFAHSALVDGVWLFLFAIALILISPVLITAVRRWVPETEHPDEKQTTAQDERLPFSLMLVGAAGGMIAFGFIGLFLGPVLLALGYDLMREVTLGAADSSKSDEQPSTASEQAE